MKFSAAATSSPSRQIHYSDALGERDLREISQVSGRSPSEIKAMFQEVESNPQANCAFWESFMKTYPLDWRDKEVHVGRFQAYGYSVPATYPSLIPGVLSDPQKAMRLRLAIQENLEKFLPAIQKMSRHRASYGKERDQFNNSAKENYTEERKAEFMRQAAALDYPVSFRDEAHKQRVLEMKAEEIYMAEQFAKFCAHRDVTTMKINAELLGDYDNLNAFECHAKIFQDHVLPAVENLPKNPGSTLKLKSGGWSSMG